MQSQCHYTTTILGMTTWYWFLRKVCPKLILLPVCFKQLEHLLICSLQREILTLVYLETIIKSTDSEFHILYSY